MQALSAAIDHAFARLGFTNATCRQPERSVKLLKAHATNRWFGRKLSRSDKPMAKYKN